MFDLMGICGESISYRLYVHYPPFPKVSFWGTGAPTLVFDAPPPMLKNPIFAVCNDAEAAGRKPLFPSKRQDQVVEVERTKKASPFL